MQTTSVLAPLRAAGFEVHLLTKAAFAPLFAACSPELRVHSLDFSRGEQAAQNELAELLERERFSDIFDLHDSWRTWRWRRLLRRSALLHILRKPRWRELAILVLRWRRLGWGRGGRAARYRNFVEARLALPKSRAPLTELSPPEEAAKIRQGFGLPERYTVLLTGSAWASKQWPRQRFMALARKIASSEPVVVLGGRGDGFSANTRSEFPQDKFFDLTGLTALADCAAILAQARKVIGNDTGLLHVAEALQKDVIAIEGPTSAELGFSVYRTQSRIMGPALLCRPCSKSGKICWRGGQRLCLDATTESMVLGAWEQEA